MSKIYGLKIKVLAYLLALILVGVFSRSFITSVICTCVVAVFYGMLFYEIIRITNETIFFYSMNPFNRNLKYYTKDIEKIKVWFNDFSRGIIAVYLYNGEEKKINVDISVWEQKKLIKDLILTGLNVEEARP
jgi:hypothetical protein